MTNLNRRDFLKWSAVNLAKQPERQKLVQELADRLHAGWRAALPLSR